jgi:hypothetical protein
MMSSCHFSTVNIWYIYIIHQEFFLFFWRFIYQTVGKLIPKEFAS